MGVYHCACGGEDCVVSLDFHDFFASHLGGEDTGMISWHGKEDEIFLNKVQLESLKSEIETILRQMKETPHGY